jgi:hypothetical protein
MDNNLRKRDPRNAPGPFYAVEKLCLSCGLPEGEAPDLLANLDATGGDTYFVKQPTTPEEVERACSALDVCCVKALRYGGNDQAIIERLQKWSAECCDATQSTQKSRATNTSYDLPQLGASMGRAYDRKWWFQLFGLVVLASITAWALDVHSSIRWWWIATIIYAVMFIFDTARLSRN